MTTINPAYMEKCLVACKLRGMPKDQIANLVLHAEYIPYKWQMRFHAAAREADLPEGPTDIGLGGARGPGKSHGVLSQVGLDDAQRVDGLKVLFLRQTGNSAQESFDDLVTKAIRGRAKFKKTKNTLKFPNGSRVILGGFKNESDIDKYIGVEYDEIVIEELTQITEEKYKKLKGSLRTSKPNWRPRIYSSFNPGGIGHAWVKKMFVIPWRLKKQTTTRFIPSTFRANKVLNTEYIDYLKTLDGDLGKAWRDGEWDLFAGQFFSEWSTKRHTVSPFIIPGSWLRFRSIDVGGRNGTTSCHWYAVDPDANVWVYKEYYWNLKLKGVGRDHDEHAKAIHEMSLDEDDVEEQYSYTVIDNAVFAKAGYSETVAEVYEREGVTGLIGSAKDRIPGWNLVHKYMRWQDIDENGKVILEHDPQLRIFSTCVNMIRTLPELQHDDKHPEDLDTLGEDHAADELRYFLRTLRETKAPEPLTPVERKLRQHQEKQAAFDYQYRRK